MKKYDYSVIENTLESNAHIQELNREKLLTDVEITKDYNYKLTGVTTIFISTVLRLLLLMVMPIVLLVSHGLIIKGRRNLRHLKGGAISIAPHVLNFDSVMVTQALFPKQVIYHSQEDTFRIPYIRHLVRFLGAVPIPSSITAKANYIKATGEFLKEGKIISIFPEGSEWPYYDKIRPFQSGAFHFAVKYDVPIIPISINFRKPTGLEKLLPIKNRLVTVHIGKLLYPNKDLPFKESVEQLQKISHHNLVRMNKFYKVLNTQEEIKLEAERDEFI